MSRSFALVAIALILQLACPGIAGARARWELPEGRIAFRPICGTYAAPLLRNVPAEGLAPAYLFNVNGASSDEINRMAQALEGNGFAISNGYVSINGVWILLAVGNGVVKTQAMADRLFGVMCALEFKHIRLVHARYNLLSERTRMT